MKRTILLYGVGLAAIVLLLKVVEYNYFVHDLSLEVYLGIIAVLFAGLGIWSGLRLTRKKTVVIYPDFTPDPGKLKQSGISPRELEVLELMSQGLSNQQIADTLFVSLNTVKTHASSLLSKLDSSRRTEAVRKAREMQYIR